MSVVCGQPIVATQERPADTARDAMEGSGGTLGDQYLAGVGHGAQHRRSATCRQSEKCPMTCRKILICGCPLSCVPLSCVPVFGCCLTSRSPCTHTFVVALRRHFSGKGCARCVGCESYWFGCGRCPRCGGPACRGDVSRRDSMEAEMNLEKGKVGAGILRGHWCVDRIRTERLSNRQQHAVRTLEG